MTHLTTNQKTGGTAESAATRAGKYLTFRLAAEEYGLRILKVREIIGLMPITKMPEAPA
jgi:purine-binding chemotaxis protein CheW